MRGKISHCEWLSGGGFYTLQWKSKEDYKFFFKDNLLYLSKYITVELEDDREKNVETEKVSDTFELDIKPTTGGIIMPGMNLYISFSGKKLKIQDVLDQGEKIEEFFFSYLSI